MLFYDKLRQNHSSAFYNLMCICRNAINFTKTATILRSHKVEFIIRSSRLGLSLIYATLAICRQINNTLNIKNYLEADILAIPQMCIVLKTRKYPGK